MRYVRDWLNGSTANSGNHWVEIQAWGTATTVYIGALYEQNVSTGVVTSYYYAGSTRVAMRQGSSVYWLVGDHPRLRGASLGSASVMLNSSGAKIGEMRYTPFGETRLITGSVPTDRRYIPLQGTGRAAAGERRAGEPV